MISGSVRGVAKPITIVAREAHPTVGSTPADLIVQSRVTHAAHLQDEYPTATVLAAHQPGLDGGVHTRLLGALSHSDKVWDSNKRHSQYDEQNRVGNEIWEDH